MNAEERVTIEESIPNENGEVDGENPSSSSSSPSPISGSSAFVDTNHPASIINSIPLLNLISTTITVPLTLISLPPELLLQILSHLDIPELHTLTQTSHYLRTLSLDPLLHRHRLLGAKSRLAYLLARRPSLYSLRYEKRIYLSGREFSQKTLSRNLAKIRVGIKLRNRPDPAWLVERGVLPKGYLRSGLRRENNDDRDIVCGKMGNTTAAKRTAIAKLQPDCMGLSGNTRNRNRERSINNRTRRMMISTLSSSSNTYIPTTSSSTSNDYEHRNDNGDDNYPTKKRKTPNNYTCTYIQSISPVLCSRIKYLEKKLIKCYLQSWVTRRPSLEEAKSAGWINDDVLSPSWSEEAGLASEAMTPKRLRPSVRYLVRRFASRSEGKEEEKWKESRWGRGARGKRGFGGWGWDRKDLEEKGKNRERDDSEIRDRHPPRAKVLGLRRFWESKSESQSVDGFGSGGNKNRTGSCVKG